MKKYSINKSYKLKKEFIKLFTNLFVESEQYV